MKITLSVYRPCILTGKMEICAIQIKGLFTILITSLFENAMSDEPAIDSNNKPVWYVLQTAATQIQHLQIC